MKFRSYEVMRIGERRKLGSYVKNEVGKLRSYEDRGKKGETLNRIVYEFEISKTGTI